MTSIQVEKFLLVYVKDGEVFTNVPGDKEMWSSDENVAPVGAWEGWSDSVSKEEALEKIAEFLGV